MIYQAVAFLTALAAVVLRFTQVAERKERAWTEERRELLNRIQHPDLLPLVDLPKRKPRDMPTDEFDLAGTIDFEDAE